MLTSEIQRLKSTLGLRREGQGFLKVQVAEEWRQRTVWQQPQDLSLAELGLWVKRALDKGLATVPCWSGLCPHFCGASQWCGPWGPSLMHAW